MLKVNLRKSNRMKFEIKGDKQKIKEFLEEFKNESIKEYERQVKNVTLPIPVNLPPFDCDYYDDGDKIIFWTVFGLPKLPKILMRKPIKRMEKNLKLFFEAKGIKVDVKLIGD